MQIIIQTVPIDSLFYDPTNARTHGKKNMDAIKSSIAMFKQVEPLIVNRRNNIVIGGNGRLAAMKEMGFKEVEVHFVDLNDAQATALALALNRTSELASWDNGILGHQLQSLWDDGFDIAEIGFDPTKYIADLPVPGTRESLRDPPPVLSATEHLVVVTCASEFDQADLYERLKAEGYECKIMS